MVKGKNNNTEESEDESNKGEIRYNGQIISSMLVKEIKSALEKLGVPVKRTDRKAQCEELLREALKNHAHHIASPASSRRKGGNDVLRSKSIPPASGRSLRSAGYGLRSRDNSSKRGKASGDAGTGHIKASVATGESGTYEDHDMIFYSVKGNMPVSSTRSPSATSQRSRSRPSRSARSTRTNTAVSDEDKSQDGEDEEQEEEKGSTVVKKRKPSPRKSRSVASPKQTKTGRSARKQEREEKEEEVEEEDSENSSEEEEEEGTPTPVKTTSKVMTKSPAAITKASPTSAPASMKKKVESRRSSHSSQQQEASTSSKKSRRSSGEKRQLDELAMLTALASAVENAADEMESMDEEEKELYEALRHGEGSDNEDSDQNEEEEEDSGEDSEVDAALNDSGNFFDAEYGQEDDENESASEGEEHSESGDDSEGEQEEEDGMVVIGEEEEGDSEDEEGEGDFEGDDDGEEGMEVIEVGEGDSQEDGDSQDEEEEDMEEGDSEGEGQEEGESEEDDGVEGSGDEEDEDDEEFAFNEPGLPEVVDLMSDSEEGEEEEPYVAPAFPTFSFTAPTPNSKPSFGSSMTGTNTTTTAVPTFTFSMGSNGPQIDSSITANPFAPNPFAAPAKPFESAKPAPAKQPVKAAFNPFAAMEGKLSAPIKPLPPFGVPFNPNPVPVVSQETVKNTPLTTVAVATTPAVSTVPPALSDLSPAALAFSKLSNSFVSVFANNLTSTKKEKLSVEEYSLLKSLLESSKPAEVEAAEKAAAITTMNDTVKKAVQFPENTLNTDITTSTDMVVVNNQEEKENKATKTISFSTGGDASIPRPRTSYDGSWNSRESFLPSPSPSGSPAATKAAATGVDSVASKITFDAPANERLARRLPTPYHPMKRTAFSAGWTGGSEVSMLGDEQEEEDTFALLPPSKRQSLEGYRSIQFRQQTPGPSHYGHNRLSVGSGMLEDTPAASSWTGGSTVRNSLSGYPPSGLPLGRPGHTPMFRGNALGYTPSTAQSAVSIDSRISRLPVSTAGRYSIGGPPPSGHAGVAGIAPSSLSYIQRRKLQLKSDNTASAAVAKKILETLGGLSTPLEEQRKKPLAIKWQDEEEVAKPASVASKSNGSTPLTTASTPASAPRVTFGEVKVAPTPTFSSAIKPSAPSAEVKKTTIPSTADLSSPYLHSSIRKPTEQQIEQRQERRVVAAQIAADKAASVGDDEFTFEEPTVVNGIEDHMIEEVDRSSGQTKRRLSMPVDQSVKYIFTPPNKSRKSTETSSISVSTTKTAAATTSTSKAIPAVSSTENKMDTAPSVNIWAASSINDGVKCSVCMVRNKKDAVKCASCESPLTATTTATKKDTPSATSAPASSGMGIWAAASINSGIKCDACMVRNKEGATKCASCEAPLKSAPSTAAPASTVTSTASAFGAPAKAADAPGTIGKGGFTFGASTATTPASGSAPTFGGFGTVSSAPATEAKPSAGGFTFPGAGATTEKPAAATTPAAGGFTFGAASTTTAATTTPSTAPATSNPFGGFSFGTTKPSTETPSEASKPAAATPAATSLPAFSTPSFGTKPASTTTSTSETSTVKRSAEADSVTSGREESEDQPSAKKRAGGFGGGESSTPAAAPAFGGFSGFASSSGSSAAPAASPAPSFGGFPALPAGVDLGNSSGDKPKPAVSFGGFGATAPVTVSSATKASEGGFTFGASMAANKEEKKVEAPAAITFGAAPSTADSKTEAPKPFTFGSATSAGSDKKAEEPKTSFTFGASSTAVAPAAVSTEPKPFMFGGASATTATPASTETKPFMFGATTPAAPSASTTPAVASSTGLPALPAFQFGATTTPTTTGTALTGFAPAKSTSGTSLPALATTFTAGKPPLASPSNSIGGASSTNAFGVAAVDSRTSTTFPPAAATTMSFGSGSMNTASPGMDMGSTAPTGTGNPFSSSAFPAVNAPVAAGPFGSTPSFDTAAPAANPFSSAFGSTAGAPAAAPAPSLGGSGFTFGSNNNLAVGSGASPAFGASPFGAGAPAPVAGNPFGGPQQSSGFGAPAGAPFGGAPAAGPFSMPNSGSSGNLYGAGAAGGQQGAMGGFNAPGAGFGAAAGAFGGSSNNLNAMGGPLGGTGNAMGMGGFGGAPSAAPAAGGGFSLGAADKTTAPRRKVVVPKRK